MSPTEADGVACVDVSDPRTGSSFRLYDFEYQLALQLNGQPVAQVTDWASKTYGADLTAEGITEFAARLVSWDFSSRPRRPRLRQLGLRWTEGSDAQTVIRAGNEAASPAAPAPAEPAPAAPAPAEPASAEDDASDGGAAEWESAQAAKTAQFVPDLAMLDSAPEPTPVVPLDVLKLTSGIAAAPEGAPTAIHGEVTAQAIVELPSEALDSEPVSAPPVRPSRRGAPKPDVAAKSTWATDSRRSAAVFGLSSRRQPAAGPERRSSPADASGPGGAPRRRASPSAASRPSPKPS